MATGSGTPTPPSSMTLPEINIGWTGVSVAVFRLVGMLVRDGLLFPPFTLRWAMAAEVSAVILTNIKAMKREELKVIAILQTWDFLWQCGTDVSGFQKCYAFCEIFV